MSTILSFKDIKPNQAIKMLSAEIAKVKSTEEFTTYLNFISTFPTYSFYNQMLIQSQKPNATRVKGFVSWKKSGRHVNKDEHGIHILAPRFYKKEVQKDDSIVTIDGKYFVFANVFDISQTSGDPIPDYSIDITETPEIATKFYDTLCQYCITSNITVNPIPLRDTLYGTSYIGKIEINSVKNIITQALTLVHEIAHEEIHNLKARYERSKEQMEYEAESVSYIIAKRLNIANNSAKYLALYKNYDLNQSLEEISKTAKKILDYIVPKLLEGTPSLPIILDEQYRDNSSTV